VIGAVTDSRSTVIVLPGAGGGNPDLELFESALRGALRFEAVHYPGWPRYVAREFSAPELIADLTQAIGAKVPQGPIRILGNSIGGHFGYAAAVSLERSGREIAGFCAIDSFMVSSAGPRAGWKGRAAARAWDLLARRRSKEFMYFVRSLCWRSLLRLTPQLWPPLLRRWSGSGRLPWYLRSDPVFENELSMRLLIREAAPWIGMLDQQPVALTACSVLLRTPGTRGHDAAWRRRCPNIKIIEVPGRHHTVLDKDNLHFLHKALVTAFAQ
jgi:thioesterase domain-containing protein